MPRVHHYPPSHGADPQCTPHILHYPLAPPPYPLIRDPFVIPQRRAACVLLCPPLVVPFTPQLLRPAIHHNRLLAPFLCSTDNSVFRQPRRSGPEFGHFCPPPPLTSDRWIGHPHWYPPVCCSAPPLHFVAPLRRPPAQPTPLWMQWCLSPCHRSSPLKRHQGMLMSGVLISGALWARCAPLHRLLLLLSPQSAPIPGAPIPSVPSACHLASPIPRVPCARRLVHATCLCQLLLHVGPCLDIHGDPDPWGIDPWRLVLLPDHSLGLSPLQLMSQ